MAVGGAEVVEREVDDVVDEPGSASARRPERQRWWIVGASIGLLALVGGMVWWVRTPRAFMPQGGVVVSATQPPASGSGWAVGMVVQVRSPDATIDAVEARVADGSAPVATGAVICIPRPGQGGVGLVMLDELGDSCARVLPAVGRNLADVSGDLVLTVVPLGPGRVTIRGVDVSYHQGSRRTTQATGVTFAYRPSSR